MTVNAYFVGTSVRGNRNVDGGLGSAAVVGSVAGVLASVAGAGFVGWLQASSTAANQTAWRNCMLAAYATVAATAGVGGDDVGFLATQTCARNRVSICASIHIYTNRYGLGW